VILVELKVVLWKVDACGLCQPSELSFMTITFIIVRNTPSIWTQQHLTLLCGIMFVRTTHRKEYSVKKLQKITLSLTTQPNVIMQGSRFIRKIKDLSHETS